MSQTTENTSSSAAARRQDEDVLLAALRHGPVSKALATTLLKSKYRATAMLNRMLADGLVERTGKARAVRYLLTTDGTALAVARRIEAAAPADVDDAPARSTKVNLLRTGADLEGPLGRV